MAEVDGDGDLVILVDGDSWMLNPAAVTYVTEPEPGQTTGSSDTSSEDPLGNLLLLELKELCHEILSHFFWRPKLRFKCIKNLKKMFANEEKHQSADSKAKRNKDGWGWRRLKRIGNYDFEKFSHFFFFFQNTRTVK